MRVTLVGADFEENLGIGMIAAVAAQAGHAVEVVPFNDDAERDELARRVAASGPDVVGLSIQFQHRASEFLELARALRASGFRGHLTCGGQWPTLAWREVLEHGAFDTVVLHEGERSFPELLDALAHGRRPSGVAGLATRLDDGAPARTAPRALEPDLDTLPFAARYREPSRHLGIPFLPLMGGRGCWGSCSYCSITSFYRDARAYGGGKTVRLRSPRSVAAEMALLWHRAGGAGIFCFHDDNFLLPRPSDTLARVRAIRDELAELGVERDVALIGKCRPDCVTPELARELRALGVIRLYVGVENASQAGADHLNRRTQAEHVRDALRACREAGIFVCYNLLLFEPEATLDDVRENVAFMREHAVHPVNFCRAEPYHGTPLQLRLASRDALSGGFLGYGYRIADPRTEVAFRIAAAAFRQRNFDPAGVANRTMGLGYSMKVLEQFYPERRGRLAELARRSEALTSSISRQSAGYLEEVLELAAHTDDPDRIARLTAVLGLRVAAADRTQHEALDQLYADMALFARGAAEARPAAPTARTLSRRFQQLAVGVTLALGASACNACGGPQPVDPPPPPIDQRRDPGNDNPQPVDPPPPPMPVDPVPPPNDPVPPPVDPAPPPTVVDPPPPPMPIDPVPGPVQPPPVVDPVPAPHKSEAPVLPATSPARRLALVDQWRDTTAATAGRTADLPLAQPPSIGLRAVRDGDGLRVTLEAPNGPLSLRWQSAGTIVGRGRDVRWTPASNADQLRVAVRTLGGVAVAAIRARDVT